MEPIQPCSAKTAFTGRRWKFCCAMRVPLQSAIANPAFQFAFATVLVLVFGPLAYAIVPVRSVALTSEPAPDTPDGVTFSRFPRSCGSSGAGTTMMTALAAPVILLMRRKGSWKHR